MRARDLDYVIALDCQLLAWMMRAKPALPSVEHYAQPAVVYSL
jgi:hypothetical protein